MNIGIDFGSTYSMVARYNNSFNTVEAITFAEGEPASVPSVVSISKKGQVTCGKGAKDQVGKKTVRIFEAFKMLLTETNQEMLLRRGYDETYNPKEVKVHEKKKVVHNLCTTYLHSASFLTNSFIWLATFVTSWRNSAAVIRKTPE